jgi:hypothetical protein
MTTTLSLRRLWTLYERTSVAHGTGGEGNLAPSHLAFYSGARWVLKVLAFSIERCDYEELHETIRRHGPDGSRSSGASPRRVTPLREATTDGSRTSRTGVSPQASEAVAPGPLPVPLHRRSESPRQSLYR